MKKVFLTGLFALGMIVSFANTNNLDSISSLEEDAGCKLQQCDQIVTQISPRLTVTITECYCIDEPEA